MWILIDGSKECREILLEGVEEKWDEEQYEGGHGGANNWIINKD